MKILYDNYDTDDLECEALDFEFEHLKYDFNRFLNQTESKTCLLVGTVGRWDGTYDGGFFIETFNNLCRFWDDCDYVKIWEHKGHLYVKASHHDGTNYGEIKLLTKKGIQYKNSHPYNPRRELHSKIFNDSHYSVLPRITERMV